MFPFAHLHCPNYFLLHLHLDQRVDQEVNHGWTVHHSLLGHYHCHGVGHYHCHFHCRGFGHCHGVCHCHGVGHCLARATTTVWGLGHCQPRPSPRPLHQKPEFSHSVLFSHPAIIPVFLFVEFGHFCSELSHQLCDYWISMPT